MILLYSLMRTEGMMQGGEQHMLSWQELCHFKTWSQIYPDWRQSHDKNHEF